MLALLMTFPLVFLKCGIAYCELGKRKKNGNSHNEVYMVFVALLPPATKLGQGYVFTRVCDSVQGGCLPQCMLGYTPPEQTPPPGSRHPEQTPPLGPVHDGRYGQQAGGTHPTGMPYLFSYLQLLVF